MHNVIPRGLFGGFLLVFLTLNMLRAQSYFRDDFNGAISSSWTIIRQDAGYYSVTPSNLVLRASSGYLTGAGNSAKNLFLVAAPTNDAFAVTLCCSVFELPAVNYAQIDVLAYDSDDNHVRCNYGYIVNQRQLEFGQETSASWTPWMSPHDFGGRLFYLRLVKVGNWYRQLWSTNGIQYHQQNPTIQYGDGTPQYIGFTASDDPSQSALAHVDWFEAGGIAAPPCFRRIQAGTNGVDLDLAGLINGVSNTLQRCEYLLSPTWTNLFSFTASDTFTNYTDSANDGLGKVFYRLITY